MKTLLTATALVANLLVSGNVANAKSITSQQKANVVGAYIVHKDKCTTPASDRVTSIVDKLRDEQGFSKKEATIALVGIYMTIDKVGTGAWCRSMTKTFQTVTDYFEE